MKSAARGFMCTLLVIGCGDPVAPAVVTSEAFDVKVELVTKNQSRTGVNRDVLVRFTIRNPMPVRATLQQTLPSPRTEGWWAAYLEDVDNADRVLRWDEMHHGPITLSPGEVLVHTAAFHVFPSASPGRYRFWGGVLGSWHYAGMLELLP